MSGMHKDIDNQIKLSFACPMSWEAMPGTDKERSCAKCSCTVQNITDYTSEERRDLQNRIDAGEKICVAMPEAAPTASALDVCRQVLRDYAALRYGALAGKIAGIALSACLLFGSYTCKPAIAEPYKTHIQYSDKQFYKDKAGCYFFVRPVPILKLGEASNTDLNDLGRTLLWAMERDEKADAKDKLPVLSSPVAKTFLEEYHHGIIARSTLDNFATECTESGQFNLAATIQRTSKLIERSGKPLQEPPVKAQPKRDKILQAKFEQLLKQVDKSSVSKPTEAIEALLEAARYRRSYQEITCHYDSRLLTKRYDKLEEQLPGPVLKLKLALEFAPFGKEESLSIEASKWKQAQEVNLAALRQKIIAESDKQAKEKDYNGAYESLEQAAKVRGPLITQLEQQQLSDRLLDLMPSLDLSKGIDCIKLLNEISAGASDAEDSVLDLTRFKMAVETSIDRLLKTSLPIGNKEQEPLASQFMHLAWLQAHSQSAALIRERRTELKDKLVQLMLQSSEANRTAFFLVWQSLEYHEFLNSPEGITKDRYLEMLDEYGKLYKHSCKDGVWSAALNTQLSMGKFFMDSRELRASAQYDEYLNHYLEIANEADSETIKKLWNSLTWRIFDQARSNIEEDPALAVAKLASVKIYDRLFAEIDSEIDKHKYKEAMNKLNDTAKLANTGWTHIYESARKHGLIPTEKIAARMKSIRDKVDPLDAALIDYWIEFYRF